MPSTVDGDFELVASAVDYKGRQAQQPIMVIGDRMSPPRVTPFRPRAEQSYDGAMTISAEIVDFAGVSTVMAR